MAATEAALVIVPAIIVGGIIGIIEMIFVHSDEIGMGWFMHGLHALPFTMAFAWVSINVSWAYGLLNLKITESLWVDLGIRAAIAVIAMIKIQAAAAIAGRVGERFYHTIAIGLMIFAVGFFWKFIGPAIMAILPSGLRF